MCIVSILKIGFKCRRPPPASIRVMTKDKTKMILRLFCALH